MTTVQQQEQQQQCSNNNTFSKHELDQARQCAKQAVRNLSPGSTSTISPLPAPSFASARQSSPKPQMSHSPSHSHSHSQQQLLQLQQHQRFIQQQQELGALGNNHILGNGLVTPRARILGSPNPPLPMPGLGTHFRNKSTPSTIHQPQPPQLTPQPQSQLIAQVQNSNVNAALLQQQMLNNELYTLNNATNLSGIRRSDSNPSMHSMQLMNASQILARKSSDSIRNGHSQKMTHSYANGKSSPVAMRSGMGGSGLGGNRPPVYPNMNPSMHAVGQNQGVPPTLRSVASLNGSYGLGARLHHNRSGANSLNLSIEEGDDGSIGYSNAGLLRHSRANSGTGQIDAYSQADQYKLMVLQQQQQQQQQQQLLQQQQQFQQQNLSQHVRMASGGSIGGDQNALQQQQLLAAIKQELQDKQLVQQLLAQNGGGSIVSEAMGVDIYNTLLDNNNSITMETVAALTHTHLSQTQQSLQMLHSQNQVQRGGESYFVPPKLELCTQLLGGSEVANQNLAAIPEVEQQIFSVVADLLHMVMLGDNLEEVLASIRAIVSYTRNEQASLHSPMPQAFSSWLRRLALIMPLISAVYQVKEHNRTVREGFATLIRIFAEPYPKLGQQLESLMGMGEAAAVCADATNLWRQIVALLEDQEGKLKQMECEPLQGVGGDCYDGRYTRASTGSDNSAVQMGVEACHRLMDSVSDFQECENRLTTKTTWGDILNQSS